MKKVKLYPTLVISFILSLFSVATAALEHTTTYGTQPPPFGIDASLKQVTLPSSPGMAGASVGRSPAVIAAIEKQVAADKAAYCKKNNYPTHVPFCAGLKEQERQEKVKQCKATEATRNHAAQGVKNECVRRHTYNATAQKNQCSQVTQATTQSTVTINTGVVNGTANGSQVVTPRDTCRQQIDDQLDLDKIGCNNDYHDATSPMNCDSI